jgi:glucose/arabinose dehydrogenase
MLLGIAATALALTACAGTDSGADATRSPTASPSPSPTTSPTPTAPTPPAEPALVAQGLAAPWGLAFLPDGSALVTVRDTAEIVWVRRDAPARSLGRVPGVSHGGEGGLLGIAVSPDVATDRTAYVYATTDADNRVFRLRLDDVDDPQGFAVDRPVVVGIPRSGNHNGGRIAFGPDGFLYVATGDAGVSGRAQDLDSLGGKILRVTSEGEAAPGNPRPGSPLWSWGHRNVQGLAWDERGRLFASEFGQNRWDELNLIEAGGNYGWPDVEGVGGGGFIDPLVTWTTDEASPSGIAIVGDAIHVAALRGESLWRVPLVPEEEGGADGAVVGEPQRLLAGEYGRLRAVEPDGQGNVWLLTSNVSRGIPRPGDDRVVVVDLRTLG